MSERTRFYILLILAAASIGLIVLVRSMWSQNLLVG